MKLPWGGRPPKPDSVRLLEADHGAALAWGLAEGARPVLATADALVIGGPELQVLPWHLVDRAVWEPPAFAITAREEATGAPVRLRLELQQHGELPPVVRERVTRSVVVSRRIPLRGDAGAVVAARRDSSGGIRWTVVFDQVLDHADPALQEAARAALAELRSSYGT